MATETARQSVVESIGVLEGAIEALASWKGPAAAKRRDEAEKLRTEFVQPRLRRACTSTSSSHVSMTKRASFDEATGVRHQQLGRRPALLGGATRVGNFHERQWGISASAVTSRTTRC